MLVDDCVNLGFAATKLFCQLSQRRSCLGPLPTPRAFVKLSDEGHVGIGDLALDVIFVGDVRPVAFSVCRVLGLR